MPDRASGPPEDGSNIVQVLFSGIAGRYGITLDVSGLTVRMTLTGPKNFVVAIPGS